MNGLGNIESRDYHTPIMDSLKRSYLRRSATPEYKQHEKEYHDERNRKSPLVVRESWGKCL